MHAPPRAHTPRFFLSLEDSLFRVFGGDKIKNLMVAFRCGAGRARACLGPTVPLTIELTSQRRNGGTLGTNT